MPPVRKKSAKRQKAPAKRKKAAPKRKKAAPKKKKTAPKRKKAAPKKKKTALKRKKSVPKKKKAAPKKKASAPSAPTLAGEEVGRVVAFFRIPMAAIIKVTQGTINIGDKLWVKGHTTDMKVTVASMEIDRTQIQSAKKGQEIGLKVSAKARRSDRVYLIK